ncbi:hypothetical protein [Burkholderia sp. Ac-20365]|uniref:hypothetical protein n=1 Tax=Burkholderia sp. Ac-20365 TaxID=2703897 RepID=UPI00197B83EF|nr:hypothetical protein [Burkholderia sp. Ac-20365]MBN3760972.1 hypothetical protein [Burkholderia sp. Ac-20365]
MKFRLSEELRKELTNSLETLVRFAADVFTSVVMLFLVAKSALFSHSVIEGLAVATHDTLTSDLLSAAHVVTLVLHVFAFGWVSWLAFKRFVRSLK